MNLNLPQGNQEILVVRCRLIPDFNICAAISVLMTLFFLGIAVSTSLKTSEIQAFAVALTLTIIAPLYWLIARIRGAIILDESGVRWRTAFSGWKSARWDEVENGDMRFTSTTTQWKFVVSTRRGAFSWTRAFQNAEQWAPFAARHCPRIPAEIESWPRVFNYRSVENGIPVLAFPLFAWWLIAPLWILFSSSPPIGANNFCFKRK
ncbi:hypothetical protein B1R32_11073 [Abditibacterium utsteinense]|uniref:PH domain-containing protein n=1 Tax=Abditibacterium utsteinense TaxID=1960156 RepID=A0A2S8SS41_9BACT|nr:hypothetical protein [Abditibacterium utsteinense]PQV63607.1 hypothetical protein B1R32_11073 [Abditibacterium utsteinense]